MKMEMKKKLNVFQDNSNRVVLKYVPYRSPAP